MIVGLRLKNDGAIESAIMFTAKLKLVDSSVDITKLQNMMEQLSVTHPSPVIRYEAFLASNICSNPGLYLQEKLLQVDYPVTFFTRFHSVYKRKCSE